MRTPSSAHKSQIGTDGDEEKIEETRFKLVSGQQRFLGQIRTLIKETEEEHLREALFATWHYRDRKLSVLWDPADDRRYALRASDPSDTNRSPIQTVRGANRLAVEALDLFPVMSVGTRPATRASGK